jgi:hypothetical protein
MVNHNTLADARFLLADALADRRNDAARFVTGNDGSRFAKAKSARSLTLRSAIHLQIAAAHA